MIKAKTLTITPDMAATMLADNTHNRPVNNAVVTLFATAMRAKKWELNGEPIIVADDGSIMDGQHRLLACLESKKPFPTLLVSGIDKSTFATIDIGRSRSGRDILSLELSYDKKMATTLASAARFSILLEHFGSFIQGTYKGMQDTYLTRPENILAFVKSHRELEDIATQLHEYKSNDRTLPIGQAVSLYYYMDQRDPDTFDFWNGLWTGADLSPQDPRLVLRNRCFYYRTHKFVGRKWTPFTRATLHVRTWDWFIKDRECRIPNNLLGSARYDNSTVWALLKAPVYTTPHDY